MSGFYDSFVASFLIALREGVEATLIVGIIIGYLVQVGRRDILKYVWSAVSVAVAIPLILGYYFVVYLPQHDTFHLQEKLGGFLSVIAAGFITWMIIWMGLRGKDFASSIKQDAASALEKGSMWGIVALAFISVAREGLETALMFFGVADTVGEGENSELLLWGLIAGFMISIWIGYLVYLGVSFINIKMFFNVTGYLLIFVAAGILMYGIKDLQETGIISGINVYLYDYSLQLKSINTSFWFVLVNAFFQIEYLFVPTHAQFISWIAYIMIALPLFTFIILKGRMPFGLFSSRKNKVSKAENLAAQETTPKEVENMEKENVEKKKELV
ncbi:MAG: FTR1 family protein [Actinomycetaceae bacterium]|nr:FTR1 family protein [Actinomycetaceae bacterium]